MSDEGKTNDAADGVILSVDRALERQSSEFGSAPCDAAILAAEVRRLRSLFGGFQLECCDDWTCAQARARKAGETIAALREASRVTAENFGKAQLEIANLQTQVARVEALSEKMREPQGRTREGKPLSRHLTGDQVADEIDYALRVPHAPMVLEQLRAKLARVEALPAKWEAEHEESDAGLDAYDCAQALRITLRDDSSDPQQQVKNGEK